MQYKWRLVYRPPLEEEKVFYISIYECPSKIDLAIKIKDLKKIYNMKDEYITLQDLDGLDE